MAVCQLLLAAIVAIIFYQVVARYFFNRPLAWMEEFGTYAFIWMVMIGAGVAAKDHRHILVDVFPAGPTARFLGQIMTLIAMGAMAKILWHAAPIVVVEMRSSTVSLPINVERAWVFSIPLIYALCSIMLACLNDLLSGDSAEVGS
jgi:TRAP-type C4-dicarboxylate transport system permease small subunit